MPGCLGCFSFLWRRGRREDASPEVVGRKSVTKDPSENKSVKVKKSKSGNSTKSKEKPVKKMSNKKLRKLEKKQKREEKEEREKQEKEKQESQEVTGEKPKQKEIAKSRSRLSSSLNKIRSVLSPVNRVTPTRSQSDQTPIEWRRPSTHTSLNPPIKSANFVYPDEEEEKVSVKLNTREKFFTYPDIVERRKPLVFYDSDRGPFGSHRDYEYMKWGLPVNKMHVSHNSVDPPTKMGDELIRLNNSRRAYSADHLNLHYFRLFGEITNSDSMDYIPSFAYAEDSRNNIANMRRAYSCGDIDNVAFNMNLFLEYRERILNREIPLSTGELSMTSNIPARVIAEAMAQRSIRRDAWQVGSEPQTPTVSRYGNGTWVHNSISGLNGVSAINRMVATSDSSSDYSSVDEDTLEYYGPKYVSSMFNATFYLSSDEGSSNGLPGAVVSENEPSTDDRDNLNKAEEDWNIMADFFNRTYDLGDDDDDYDDNDDEEEEESQQSSQDDSSNVVEEEDNNIN